MPPYYTTRRRCAYPWPDIELATAQTRRHGITPARASSAPCDATTSPLMRSSQSTRRRSHFRTPRPVRVLPVDRQRRPPRAAFPHRIAPLQRACHAAASGALTMDVLAARPLRDPSLEDKAGEEDREMYKERIWARFVGRITMEHTIVRGTTRRTARQVDRQW